MSTAKKPDRATELDLFDNALIDGILAASENELQELACAGGDDLAAIAHRFDAMRVAAKAACSLQKLRNAQVELEAFHASRQNVTDVERGDARAKIEAARSRKAVLPSGIMLAARKGRDASKSDLDSMSEDLAELERLEQLDSTPSTGGDDRDAG